jgi:DNA-binding winged helix-turn-helix (wHTH) protein
MNTAVHDHTATIRLPVIICIADEPRERARLASRFDGAGVMVLARDLESAQSFLGNLQPTAPALPTAPTRPVGRVERGERVVRIDGLRLNIAHHEATWHDEPLQLTPHELKVLSCLASSPGRLWAYQQLHEDAWDDAYFTGPAAVQSVVKRLRAKLRQAGLPLNIEAARGVGFRLTIGTDLHLVHPVRAPR